MGRGAGFFLLFLTLFLSGKAQYEPGASSGAMGGACIAVPDGFSVAGNPACMSWTGRFSAGASVKNEFFPESLATGIICASFRAGKGNFGVLATYSGLSAYNETTASFSYSIKIWPKFSAAVRAGYYRLSISEGYGTKNSVESAIGIYFRPSESFSAGMVVCNPFPVKTSSFPEEYLKTSIATGISWMITNNLITAADISKDLEKPAKLRVGAGYRFTRNFSVRTGFSTSPFIASFGAGIVLSNINIDISTSWHPVLGYSPQISLSYCGK